MEPQPPVRYGRIKVVGAAVIGGLIAVQGIPDSELAAVFGTAWGVRVRFGVTIVLGGFYALERYLSRAVNWHENPPTDP